jgi:hypothetical protein
MRGKVQCLFVGGPGGDEELTLPAMHCRERLSLEQDGWLKARADGSVCVMKGTRQADSDWVAFNRAVFEKQQPVTPGQVTYQFVRLEGVERCAQILEQKGRRCKHEAEPGMQYCRQHLPKA